ncbi:MAG: hypothetical protein HUJ58_10615 [Erysipelotrichaceae bacterium]|nr:hypothetical protein [Erysipelotrichaceae bacterium]
MFLLQSNSKFVSVSAKVIKMILKILVVFTGGIVFLNICFYIRLLWGLFVGAPETPKGIYQNEQYYLDFDHFVGIKTNGDSCSDILLIDRTIPNDMPLFKIYEVDSGVYEMAYVGYDRNDNLVLTFEERKEEKKVTLIHAQRETDISYDALNGVWSRVGEPSFSTDSSNLIMPIKRMNISFNVMYDGCEFDNFDDYTEYYRVRVTNDLKRIYVLDDSYIPDIIVNAGAILFDENNTISIMFDYTDENGEKTCIFRKETSLSE